MASPSLNVLIAQSNDSPRTLAARRAGIYTGTLIAAATYTSTQTGLTFQVPPGGTAQAFLVITAASGTGGLTIRFEIQDPTSLAWIIVCTSSAATLSASTLIFSVGPNATRVGGLSNSAALAYQYPLVGNCRCTVVHGDASNYTYSVNVQISGPG